MSGGADHKNAQIPAGTRGPGNEPVSMGMPDNDEKDLGRKVDDVERITGADKIRNGARDHKGERMVKETSKNASLAVCSAGTK